MIHKIKKNIAVWCEHPYQIFAAKPIIAKYRSRGENIKIYTYEKYFKEAQAFLQVEKEYLDDIFLYKSRAGTFLTRIFRTYVVSFTFSEFYFLRIKKANPSKLFKWLNAGFNAVISDYNALYHWLAIILTKLGLIKSLNTKVDLLISFTKVHHCYVLAQYARKHISIMESWDHPSKEPYLMKPKAALSWNIDLMNETRNVQNYGFVKSIRPLKFSYIDESETFSNEELHEKIKNDLLIKDIDRVSSQKTIVYPMCTSSSFYAFQGEYKFVNEFAQELKNQGINLYIRPYPLAPKKDTQFLQKLDNVYVGASYSKVDGGEVLEEEYQLHKILLMRTADCIINVGTTFIFDAAYAGARTIQVEIKSDRFGSFSSYSKGPHIKNYLIDSEFVTYENNFENILGEISNGTFQNRDKLVNWLKLKE